MPSSKTSKKTSKIVEKIAVAEAASSPESNNKPRTSRSSKTKNERTEMTSAKHHRKASPVAVSDATATNNATLPLKNTPACTVHPHQIAELAYSYWIERGYVHGFAEEDWLRAEQMLGA